MSEHKISLAGAWLGVLVLGLTAIFPFLLMLKGKSVDWQMWAISGSSTVMTIYLARELRKL